MAKFRHHVMAALDSDNFEAKRSKRTQDLLAVDGRLVGHGSILRAL